MYLKKFPVLNDVSVSRKKEEKSFLIRLPLVMVKERRFFLLQFGNNKKVCKNYFQYHTNTRHNFGETFHLSSLVCSCIK